MASSTLLLTGFAPFGTDRVNPSWLVAQALHGQRVGGLRIEAAQLPTAFGASLEHLAALRARFQPALILCLGQAGGRAALSFERIGINIDDARIPDNEGAQPVDTPVVPYGPAAYFSTLPIKRMARAAHRAGVPSEVSQTAGTYVCNHVLYGLLHQLAHQTPGVRGGFAHLPWMAEQGSPHLALRRMVRGIHEALWAAVLHEDDLAVPAGALH